MAFIIYYQYEFCRLELYASRYPCRVITHIPTILDAASDLLRGVYFSLTEGIEGKNVHEFVEHSKSIISNQGDRVFPSVSLCIEKFMDPSLTDEQRREYLLTASLLCR